MGSHNQQSSSSFTSSFSHHSSLHTSSSSKFRLLFLSSSLLLLFVNLLMLEPPQGAQAAPYSGHGFNIKQRSAIQALRNLDNQYMAQNRPRFGKRFSPGGGEQVGSSYFSEGGAVPLASAESLGASTKPVLSSPGAIIGDKWVLVNRARPLSKAAETIFREMLSDTERYRSSSNGGGAEEVEQK